VIPQPEHAAAITAENALGFAFLLRGQAAVFDRFVFLDQVLPLLYLQGFVDAAKIDGAACAAALTTDAAGADLVGNGGVGLDTELDAAALAAAFEFHGHCDG